MITIIEGPLLAWLEVTGDSNSPPPHQNLGALTNEGTVPREFYWADSFNTQKQGLLENTEQLLTANKQPATVCCSYGQILLPIE
jgi:hypothetical protein